ncbi:MAG: addiction module protein [Gemmatimonadales bacterium]
MTRETLEAQLLRLPPEDRAHLAKVLIESLDEQPDLDPAWIEEAERRAADLASGAVGAVPAEQAIAEARRRLAG